MELYEYNPLPNQNHIRLVTIKPDSFSSEVSVSIEIVPFSRDKPPKYEALSYVWGTGEHPVRISINNDPFSEGPQRYLHITKNLHVALKYLRRTDSPRTLWIDAICINQNNIHEKGPQVAMMDTIYTLADRVVAWLGPEANDSDQAMSIMSHLGSQIKMNWETWQPSPAAGADPSFAEWGAFLPYDVETIASILRLLGRPWFERIWIRQEIYLANSRAIMIRGTSEAPWPAFHNAMAALYYKPALRSTPQDLRHEKVRRLTALRGFIYHSRIGFGNIRSKFGTAQCKDPRDRIFAVLGLLNSQQASLGVTPDYTKTTLEVYRDVVLRWISHFNDASILEECQLSAGETVNPTFPSWILDWSRNLSEFSPSLAISASSHLSAHYEVLPGQLALRLAGMVVSSIKQLGPGAPLYGKTRESGFDRVRKIVPSELIQSCHSRDDDTLAIKRQRSKGGINVIKEILSGSFSKIDVALQSQEDKSISRALTYVEQRRFCQATSDLPVLAPEAVQLGDQVCVLLGCPTPVLLRPISDRRFRFIGACVYLNASYGEALLGPLPEGVRMVYSRERSRWGFLDENKQEFSLLDPRLRALPLDLREFSTRLKDDPLANVHVTPEVLNKYTAGSRMKGCDIQVFDLV
ncbi:hypothetical protein AAE478_005313 [Parahypoxylon ruwenzoriense]